MIFLLLILLNKIHFQVTLRRLLFHTLFIMCVGRWSTCYSKSLQQSEVSTEHASNMIWRVGIFSLWNEKKNIFIKISIQICSLFHSFVVVKWIFVFTICLTVECCVQIVWQLAAMFCWNEQHWRHAYHWEWIGSVREMSKSIPIYINLLCFAAKTERDWSKKKDTHKID